MAWQVVDVPYVEYSKEEIISFFECIYCNLSDSANELILGPLGLVDCYLYWLKNGKLPDLN